MEEPDSDDSRASVITVESNVSDNVILSVPEDENNEPDQDVVILDQENAGPTIEPRPTTSGDLATARSVSVEIVREEHFQDASLVEIDGADAGGASLSAGASQSTATTRTIPTFPTETSRPVFTFGQSLNSDTSSQSEGTEISAERVAVDEQSSNQVAESTVSSLLPAIKEFIAGTAELSRLDCLTTESLALKSSDPNVVGILKSLHKSLCTLTGRADPDVHQVSETTVLIFTLNFCNPCQQRKLFH